MAPFTGVMVPLGDVPDPAFAQRLAGDGISIDPLGDRVFAPCDGEIAYVHRACHALTLMVEGIEIIIHVGLDTVNLGGKGFTAHVKAGDKVKKGDLLISFDPDVVTGKARSLLTQILVSNMERVHELVPAHGVVTALRDVALRISLSQGAEGGAPRGDAGEAIRSSPVVIAAEHGLHARPAAALAAAAREFSAELRLVKNGKDANLRSVVSIMALEVGRGDSVEVVARGADAGEAIARITTLLHETLPGDAEDSPARSGGATRQPQPSRRAPVEGELHGVTASPGVAVGEVYQLRHEEIVAEQHAADPHQERRALDAAIAAAHLQLEALQKRLGEHADSDRTAIFAAHQELLEDPEVLDLAGDSIRDGATAAYAWQQAYTAQAGRLTSLQNEMLAARAADLRDVGRRVLRLLIGQDGGPAELPEASIIIAEDLSPSDTASLDRSRVRGFCTTMGSATSHAAILARGLGIPALAGVDPRALDLANGTRVILDADHGIVRLNPGEAEENEVLARQAAAERRRGEERADADKPAVTTDGHRVEVVANIGDVSEAARVVESGGEGVGLLRTEFLFMDRRSAPDEDEQAAKYSAIATALGPDRILVIRTLDVGGDKPLSYIHMGTEANPFLGERGIRLTLSRPELLRTQVRAILRASGSGKVAMMFPMIAAISEWRAAKDIVEEERAKLGVAAIPVGIMVETSAAAMMAERFAREADFFSIGTNDLTQYTLAMDRSNPRLAARVDALHPAVLGLIARTVEGARKHGRWVGVCGALAGDPDAVPVLIGLGVDELSVDVPLIPSVKTRVRSLSLDQCRETATEALDAEDGSEVRAIVARRHR
jgi:multiphosphoryl transfer protein